MRISGPRPVILTVDDDPGIHDTYRLIFEDRYDLISALDGPAALEILGSQPVDLMLLDIRMRPMNGLVVLEQVRALRPRLPVIVVTVINRFDAGWSALRFGAVEYVTKPWDEDFLQLVVRRAVEDVASPEWRSSVGPPTPHVFIVSADLGLRAGLAAALFAQCRVDGAPNLPAAAAALSRVRCDLVIADLRSPAEPAPAALASLRRWFPEGPLLVIAPPGMTAGHLSCAPANETSTGLKIPSRALPNRPDRSSRLKGAFLGSLRCSTGPTRLL